ncbi:MAG: hypothetical protein KC561_05630 [Myxococcales bacterium]|nr:hypothetical protein [Myxococcales bacterium]
MEDLRIKLVRRVLDDPERFSRNRNFDAYEDETVQSAVRVGRLLRAVREDLTETEDLAAILRPASKGSPSVQDCGPGYILQLTWSGGRRTTFLTEQELSLLLEDEEARRCLEAASEEDVRVA